MTQRIGLYGPGGLIIVTHSSGDWETDPLYPAPAGWELWPKVYVPPVGDAVTGYDTTALTSGGQNEPNYPPCVVKPPAGGRNFVVVMPRPGDWKGHTSGQYRKGAVYLNGGDSVVFATQRADGSLRRGGFVLEMPNFTPFPTPYPAPASAVSGRDYPDDDTKQSLVLSDDSNVSSTAIVDITGIFIRGRIADSCDAGEGITGGTRRIVQIQRYRCEGIHARCAADEAGSSGNDNTSIQPGYTSNSAYTNLDTWTHCDGFQIWKHGLGELRMHDVTIESGFGGFMMPTKAGSLQTNGVNLPQVFGDVYLSRVNVRGYNVNYPETGSGSGNLSTDYPTGITPHALGTEKIVLRNYFQMGGTTDSQGRPVFQTQTCSPKHLYTAGTTVYMQRPWSNRALRSCVFPNYTGSSTAASPAGTWDHLDLSHYTAAAWDAEGVDSDASDDMWWSYTDIVHGNSGERLHSSWNGLWLPTVDTSTAGKIMLGLPLIGGVRRDYAPADRWGSAPDWNEYEE